MPLLLFDVRMAFMLLHLHRTFIHYIKSCVEIYKLQIVVVDDQLINELDDKIGVNHHLCEIDI